MLFHLLSIVIPDNSKLRFIIRAPTRDEVVELRKRVKACFESAISPSPYLSSFIHHVASARPPLPLGANIKSNSKSRMTTSSRTLYWVRVPQGMGHPNQKTDAVFSGRTFASFFKERYKGDTYPVDFGASTDFVRLVSFS